MLRFSEIRLLRDGDRRSELGEPSAPLAMDLIAARRSRSSLVGQGWEKTDQHSREPFAGGRRLQISHNCDSKNIIKVDFLGLIIYSFI
jgi:hypothetical protein